MGLVNGSLMVALRQAQGLKRGTCEKDFFVGANGGVGGQARVGARGF